MSLDVERLAERDIGDAWQLSTQVGWNQTRADWHRLLELFPETCFAGWVDGDLVATSTLATYGRRAGWIGMVLVDEDYRRRGYGSEIFQRALEAGLDADLEIVGLDATDAGRTVYSQYGFESVSGIDRWSGTLETVSDLDVTDTVTGVRSIDEIASFDRRYSGIDRSVLLGHLLDAEDVGCIRRERMGETRGYAIVRPGRTHPHVGPVVASEREDAAVLFGALAKRYDGPVVVDAPCDARNEAILDGFGLDVRRRLHRMTYDEPRSILDGRAVVAATGFEWG